MSRSVANLTVSSDSFNTWLSRTNELLNALTTEIITANTGISTGANTGNASAYRFAQLFGDFAGNTIIATTGLRGGNLAASGLLTISSNSVFTGGFANAQANVFVNNSVTQVNSSNITVTGNTALKGNTSACNIIITGNATVTNTAINGSDLFITTSNTQVNSNIIIVTGNSSFRGNSTITNIAVTGNSSITNTAIISTNTTIASNLTVTGTLHNFAGNSAFNSTNLFVDNLNGRVGIGTATPDASLAVVGTANISGISRFSNTLTVVGAVNFSNTLGVTGVATFSNDVTIAGNLTVSGTRTYVNTTTLDIGDNIITLNADLPGATAPTENAGIEINRGSSANSRLQWNESSDTWQITSDSINFYNVVNEGTSNTSLDGGTLFIDALNNRVGINNTAPLVELRVTGAADISSTANVGGTLGVAGVLTGSGGLTVTGQTNTTTLYAATSANVGTAFTANSSLVNAIAINVVNQTNTATLNVGGTAVIANATGIYTTGVANAFSHTVGASFIANSILVIAPAINVVGATNTATFNATGLVNAAAINVVGATNTATFNATGLVNAAAINVVGQTNTATLYAATSANVGTVAVINATGIYTTGVANAFSFTVSTLFTANSSLVNAIAINVVNQTNTATLNVGVGAVIANATGIYTTGVANAASHTVGALFTANSSLVNAAAINVVGTTNTSVLNVTGLANAAAGLNVTGTANVSAGLNVGVFGVANGTNITNTSISVGNSSANTRHNHNLISVANITAIANLSPGILSIGTTTVNGTHIVVDNLINGSSSGLVFDSSAVANGNIGLGVGSPITIFQFVKANYSSAKMTVQTKSFTGNVSISEIILVANTSATMSAPILTVYGSITNPPAANNGAFSTVANVDGTNIDLQFTQTSQNTATKVVANLIKV